MTNPFDASYVLGETISAEVTAAQTAKINDLMQRPNALANAKLHAENDMIRMVMACNRTAWGSVTTEKRAPTPEEAASLMESLSAEAREKLTAEARAASEQRALVALMEEAQAHYHSHIEAEKAAAAEREALIAEWNEFEEYDAATKEQRFLDWRTARGGSSVA